MRGISWNHCTSTPHRSQQMTPYERRFGMHFDGPVIPFGATSIITLSLRKTNLDCISLEQVLPVIFLRYALYAGKIWKGDIMVSTPEGSMQRKC